METKTKTFDCVAESRKWREISSRRLDAMSLDERIAHLHELGEKYARERAAWEAENAQVVAETPAR